MTNHEKLSRMFFKKFIHASPPWPLYNGNADHEWVCKHSGLPWLKLYKDIPYCDIAKEIELSTHFLVDHRDQYGEHRGWQSFCIHGKSRQQTAHCDDERPWHWIPEVCEMMPKTVDFFRSWSIGSYQRLRVMALEPGGYVSLHRDPGQDGLNAMNIAICQPSDCHFVMEKWGRVPFQNGTAFLLNIHRHQHVVFNDSDQTRYHIIVHYTRPTDEFAKLVCESYHGLYSNIPILE